MRLFKNSGGESGSKSWGERLWYCREMQIVKVILLQIEEVEISLLGSGSRYLCDPKTDH
jgi:hypothetical protein